MNDKEQNEVVLLKQKSTREGFEGYMDFYACWFYNNRFYYIRVRPCFLNDLKLMCSHAIEVPPGESLEKYC